VVTHAASVDPDLGWASPELARMAEVHGVDVLWDGTLPPGPPEENDGVRLADARRVVEGIPANLRWVASLPRKEPRDVLLALGGGDGSTVSLADVAAGSRVGVTSLRARGLLALNRPDLIPVMTDPDLDRATLTGDAGVDLLVLPAHRVRKSGWTGHAAEVLPGKSWMPAPGQGGIVVLSRDEGHAVTDPWAAMHDPMSHHALSAEASFMQALGAGPGSPVCAWALPFGRWIRLWAMVLDPEGLRAVRADLTGALDDPGSLGERMASLMKLRGASALLASVGT